MCVATFRNGKAVAQSPPDRLQHVKVADHMSSEGTAQSRRSQYGGDAVTASPLPAARGSYSLAGMSRTGARDKPALG